MNRLTRQDEVVVDKWMRRNRQLIAARRPTRDALVKAIKDELGIVVTDGNIRASTVRTGVALGMGGLGRTTVWTPAPLEIGPVETVRFEAGKKPVVEAPLDSVLGRLIGAPKNGRKPGPNNFVANDPKTLGREEALDLLRTVVALVKVVIS